MSSTLAKEFVAELIRRWQQDGHLLREVEPGEIEGVSGALAGEFGPILAAGPAQEDVNRLVQRTVQKLSAAGAVELNPDLLALKIGTVREGLLSVGDLMGIARPTLFTQMFAFVQGRREALWRDETRKIDDDLFGRAIAAFDWYCLEEFRKEARAPDKKLWRGPSKDAEADTAFQELRDELDPAFAREFSSGKKTKKDVENEMQSYIQVPGWANIWTQPIINRINMLATGVRTQIGVKVFGSDMNKIQKVSRRSPKC